MIYTKDMIAEMTKEYNSPYSKITHMIKKGEIIRVRRGLYSDTAETPGEIFAPLVYSPSYLSFQYALAYHGLIPEAVFNFTCAGFGLEADKVFKTPFGIYVYKYIIRKKPFVIWSINYVIRKIRVILKGISIRIFELRSSRWLPCSCQHLKTLPLYIDGKQ